MPVQRVTIPPQPSPWHGIITDQPPTTDPQGWDDVTNFIGWKGRMRTRPGLNLSGKFSSPDNSPVLNMTSFEDIEGYLHTVALTALNAYMLSAGPTLNLLTYPVYIATAILDAAGTGYSVNDILTIVQAGGIGGTALVNTINTGTGAITGLSLLQPGNGYTNATGLPTTGGTGTGATISITTTTFTTLAGPGATNIPYAVLNINNSVYFCNGSVPLCYIDGEAQFKIAGDVPGACRFLVECAGHLIGAYWTEPAPNSPGGIIYPRRIRWSDSGNFLEWDVADPNFDAGVTDIPAADDITGLTNIGYNINIYRTNGISTGTPTGQAAQPFYILPFNQAPKGEGCPYPYTITSYNNIDRFVGNYDVWSFDGTRFTPLMDGKCNARFFADLNQSNPMSPVRGFITPVLDNGFTWLGYVIDIPGLNVTWALNITEGSWHRWSWAPQGSPTATGFSDLQFIEQVYLT